MKNQKTNIAFIVGIVIVSVGIIAAYFYFYNNQSTPKLVPCAIGDKYDIMTGKPCPPVYEEEEPATTSTSTIDSSRG